MNPCPRCGADLVPFARTDESPIEYVCPDGCLPGAGDVADPPEPEPVEDPDWPPDPNAPHLYDRTLGEVERRGRSVGP